MKNDVVSKKCARLLSILMLCLMMISTTAGGYASHQADSVPPGDTPTFIMIMVMKNGEPFKGAHLSLSKFVKDSSAPSVINNFETNDEGVLDLYGTPDSEYGSFDPNSMYEIRIKESKTLSFSFDHIIFETDEKGRVLQIHSEDPQIAMGIIVFVGSDKNTGGLKEQEVIFKVVDKDGNAVAGVPLTANIISPLGSFQTKESDQDGNVAFRLDARGIFNKDLEKEKFNSKMYSVTVSKNGQFMWEFVPEEITIYVFENGVYSEKNVPLQITVTKNDQRHLLEDMKNVIREAKEYLASHEFVNEAAVEKMKAVIADAERELAGETIPGYAIAYIQEIRKTLAELKKYEKPKADQLAGEAPNVSSNVSRASVRPDPSTKIKDESTPLAGSEQKAGSEKVVALLSLNDPSFKTKQDGKMVERSIAMQPVIHKGRTLMTADLIAMLLGVELRSADEAQLIGFAFETMVDGAKKQQLAEVDLGKKIIKFNGKEEALHSDLLEKDGKKLIPFIEVQKALKELGLGLDVKWDHETKTLMLEEIK